MITLPYDEELNIGQLSRLFFDTTNSYKFFWFQAILGKLTEDKTSFSYDEILDEMIADAWYMVTEYNLRLGPVKDNLEELVKYIASKNPFPSSEKRKVIIDYLKNAEDKQIAFYKKKLINNVPYRIQAPFLDELKINRSEWGRPGELSQKINRENRILYYYERFAQLDTKIVINEMWVPYLLKNREILRGWLQLNLIHYLQRRNPSVPGIADKLSAPQTRDIERVRKYWKLIIDIKPNIRDIYGNKTMSNERVSVDHFVPWQYVAHDELWNLHPTTKTINSSKSNCLATWDVYFGPLCKLEYVSYSLSKENAKVADAFEKVSRYHLNNGEIAHSLYCDGLTEQAFGERLCNVIRPIYDAAKNNGFKEWEYVEAAEEIR